MTRRKPVALILTRQKLPTLDRKVYSDSAGLSKGAYVLSDTKGKPDLLILATGSEVSLAVQAQEKLAADHGIQARVVSMPSWELFMEQTAEYRNEVIPRDVPKRLAVEAASGFGWAQWVGDEGDVICVDQFGASAPGSEVLKRCGFSVDNVINRCVALVRTSHTHADSNR